MTEAIPELRDSTPAERPGLIAPQPAPAMPAVAPTPAQQRAAHARQAAAARWAGKFDWETCSLEDGLAHLAEVRADGEKGGLIMQRRVSEVKIAETKCYNPDCGKIIDVANGRFAGSRTRHSPETGLTETAFACSAACYLYMTRHFTHPVTVKG